MNHRTVMTVAGITLVICLCFPALAWQDSAPGGKRWPQIPGNRGIESFYGRWQPDCDNGAWLDQGDLIIEPGGVLRYTGKKPYFPTQYRIIETTPYGVTLVVHTPADSKYDDLYDIWVLRYLRGSWRAKEPYKGAINQCHIYSYEVERGNFRWDFSDAELRNFWDNFKGCNPALTRKSTKLTDPGDLYWGDGWNQSCEIIHLTDP